MSTFETGGSGTGGDGGQGAEAPVPQSPVDVSDLTPAQAERVLDRLALLGRLFVLLIALIIGGVAAWKVFMPRPSSLPVLPLAVDATLTAADGETFALADRPGRIVLLAVLPGNCPSPCPVREHHQDIMARLGPDAARVLPATTVASDISGDGLQAGALYLIDDLGRVRRIHDSPAEAGDILRELRELLREARGR